jgi:hypothetical protein
MTTLGIPSHFGSPNAKQGEGVAKLIIKFLEKKTQCQANAKSVELRRHKNRAFTLSPRCTISYASPKLSVKIKE